MLIRNLSISDGLCNGTRLQILRCGKNIITCKILTGALSKSTSENPKEDGNIVQIPLTEFQYRGDAQQMGIAWKRLQFPLKLSFAMTINKSQGQTLNRVGLALHAQDVFSHGQQYTGFSRTRTADSIKVFCKDHGSVVRNIVYRAMLDPVEINDARLKEFCENYMDPMKEWRTEVAALLQNQNPFEVNYAAERAMHGLPLTRQHLILAYGGEETNWEQGIVDRYDVEEQIYRAWYRYNERLRMTEQDLRIISVDPAQYRHLVEEYPEIEQINDLPISDDEDTEEITTQNDQIMD